MVEGTRAQSNMQMMSSASKNSSHQGRDPYADALTGIRVKTRLAVPSSVSALKQICPTLFAHPAWCTYHSRATRQSVADKNRS
ncbi:hypothetical protein F1880_000206 [Penicillium rolfsii]|nr:hypothetical protein F1880_000206 [Penicillium rolfsii]